MTYFKMTTNDLNNGKSDAILKGDLLFCEKITPEQLVTANDIEVVIDDQAKGQIVRKAQNGYFVPDNGNPQKDKISLEAVNFAYKVVEIQRSAKRES